MVDNYQRGHETNLKSLKEIAPGALQVWSGDLTDFDVASKALSGISIVFDLAAHVCGIRDLHCMPADLVFNNLALTRNVAKASMRAGARVVYGSSSCVYDFRGAKIPHEENQIGLPFTHYGWSKLVGERVYAACKDQDPSFSYCVARIFNVYGPKESYLSPHVIPEFIQKAFRCKASRTDFEILGNGHQTRGFTYVNDIVEGLIMLAESDFQGEVVNLGSPQETRVLDLANMILKHIGVDSRGIEFRFAPAHPLDVQRRAASIEKAKRLLDWYPKTSLHEGLTKTIDWFQETHSILPELHPV